MESGIFKKLFAILMSLMLAVTMMPVSVFAEAGADASTASETQAQDADNNGTEEPGVSGTEPDADVMNRIQSLSTMIATKPVAARFMQAQSAFMIMMNDVFGIIGQAVGLQ